MSEEDCVGRRQGPIRGWTPGPHWPKAHTVCLGSWASLQAPSHLPPGKRGGVLGRLGPVSSFCSPLPSLRLPAVSVHLAQVCPHYWPPSYIPESAGQPHLPGSSPIKKHGTIGYQGLQLTGRRGDAAVREWPSKPGAKKFHAGHTKVTLSDRHSAQIARL
jgi:hypothetical protein